MLEIVAYRLNCEPDFIVCGAVTSAAKALAVLATQRPDVVVVDLVLPDSKDLKLIRQIKLHQPQCRVVVYSGQDEFVYAELALQAGAQGYVMKIEPPTNLVQAVRKVLNDEIALSSAMTKHILRLRVGRAPSQPRSPMSELTSRELEIFRLIGDGKKRAAISQEMNISPKTVAVHRDHIKDKIGFLTSAEMIREAVRWMASHG